MSEGLSRRGFFRGAAATGASLATGGAGKVAQEAVVAVGGISSMGSLSDVFASLGQSGGYPHYTLNSILCLLRYDKKRKNLSFKDLFTKIDAVRVDESNSYAINIGNINRIDFSTQRNIYDALKSIPQNIPLNILLSDELNDRLMDQPFTALKKEDRAELKAVLGKIIDLNKTGADLNAELESYFIRLAKHAISNPADFISDGFFNQEGFNQEGEDKVVVENVTVKSDICKLESLIKDFQGKDRLEKLKSKLAQARQQHEQLAKPEHFERLKKQKMDQAKWLLSEKEKREASKILKSQCPEAREGFKIELRSVETGRFIIQFERYARKHLPSRIDWLHWVQSLDPENAKAADVETDYMGMAITIKNPVALQFLKSAAADTRGDLIPVTLPNRRMGVDLNQSAPEFD
ncbi:MAG: hypothetical protein ACLFR0_05935 [Alphaproteobacteria bacterium]